VLLYIDEVAQRKFELVHPVVKARSIGKPPNSGLARRGLEYRSARGGMYARAGSEPLCDLGFGVDTDRARFRGMHQFEFALRDFINIEKHCTSRSTILIHDCYPLSAAPPNESAEPHSGAGHMAAHPHPKEISPRPERESDRHGADRPGRRAPSRPRFKRSSTELRGIVGEYLAVDYSCSTQTRPDCSRCIPTTGRR